MASKPGRAPLGQRGVVSLSVHKNTLARRRAKRYRREIADCAYLAERNFDAPIAGYCVVMWTGDAEAVAFWDGTEALGPVFLEDHVNTILRRQVARKVTRCLLDMEEPDD